MERLSNTMLEVEQKTSDTDMRDVFFDALYDIAKNDSNVMCLVADMGAFSLNRFKRDLSRQYINVSVAEQNLVSVAAGLALGGKKVFLYAIAPFITQRCYEQIKIDLSCMCLPVTLVGVGAGIAYGSDGPTHHATGDIAALRVLPAMMILNPSDSTTAATAARMAYESSGPVYVRLDKGQFPSVYDEQEDFSDGLFLLRDGADTLIISTGTMVHRAREVADELQKHSIHAGILDIYVLKPMNEKKLLGIVEQYDRVVTLEEHSIIGGLGSAVSETLIDGQKAVPVKRIALADAHCTGYGDRQWMHEYYGLDGESITRTILDFCRVPQPETKHVIRPPNAAGSNDQTQRELTPRDFACSFGTTVEDIPSDCRQLIGAKDFRYRILESEERDRVVLNVLMRIEADTQIVGADSRQDVWQKGWNENLQDFAKSGFDLGTLVPKFIRPGAIVRYKGDYIEPASSTFELDYYSVLRLWLLRKYLSDLQTVYEFGCGSGFNLAALAQLYPNKILHGLDFVSSSVEIVNKLAQTYGWHMTGHLFDMRSPDEDLEIADDSAVVTIGTIEQLAGDFEPFLQFLLRRSPALCIHVEPTVELYDEDNLVDYLAVKFHRKRGYTEGFLPRLQQLEDQGRIEIVKVKRLFFGSLLMEGYNLLIWRPRTKD
jgi:transketolase C-terminal domain/subunit